MISMNFPRPLQVGLIPSMTDMQGHDSSLAHTVMAVEEFDHVFVVTDGAAWTREDGRRDCDEIGLGHLSEPSPCAARS